MSKIKSVFVNRKKRALEIVLSNQSQLSLPFTRLELKPTALNPIIDAYVDSELGNKAVTYILKSQREGSLHLHAFLDYNRDPNYLRELLLYKMTLESQQQIKKSALSKNESTRRLKTSPSQLAMLVDPKNKLKTVDNMLRLLAVLGCDVEFKSYRRGA